MNNTLHLFEITDTSVAFLYFCRFNFNRLQ